jgi:hypothetical protein
MIGERVAMIASLPHRMPRAVMTAKTTTAPQMPYALTRELA